MKNKDYRLRKQLYQLDQMKEDGVKEAVWKLSQEQLEFFGRYYLVEEYLYVINTRRFNRIFNVHEPLIKDLHYACKKGKKVIVRKLSSKEKRVLDVYNVRYKPCKYRIVLIR